eukprot:TRINITY_DN7181_c0_g1_i1.p1 TRINITY_DN7181_c0_g1~~TRINITY_DN7181_c0_g1_i1.p1  ORF type:complete len:153 (-),score=16.69 TRINITY_DN7181_c0_g1_i1:8-466(-)
MTELWVKYLQWAAQTYQIQKPLYVDGNKYLQKYGKLNNLITQLEVEELAQTGDILLFRTEHFGAKLQRAFTGSKYDHVAILMRVHSTNKLNVCDAQSEDGCTMRAWNTFIYINTLSVSYTHLRAHETGRNLVCRLLLEKKKQNKTPITQLYQ